VERQHLKRLIISPFMVAACWSIFTYGGIVRFMSPKWDYISVFCFAALVLGLLIVPCITLANFIYWLHAPSQDKGMARSSFIGWGLALVLLFGGFTIVPWSMGWP
jgi:hypothetical protein